MKAGLAWVIMSKDLLKVSNNAGTVSRATEELVLGFTEIFDPVIWIRFPVLQKKVCSKQLILRRLERRRTPIMILSLIPSPRFLGA